MFFAAREKSSRYQVLSITRQFFRFRYILISLLASFLIPHTFITPAYAQQDNSNVTLGVSRTLVVNDKNVKNGDIVSTSDQGVILSDSPYDSQVVGIVSADAAIVLNSDQSGGVPVISDGYANVLVSSKNGTIKKGDFITTSTTPGIGEKATKTGYIIGTAMEDYDNSDANASGLIGVNLNLHYFNSKPAFPGSLTDIFKFALLTTKDGPTALFKYFFAGLVVVGSFVLGFMSFARTAAKGVEALGRNPAASRIIHLGIILNVGITVMIVFIGLIVSFLILRL